MKTSARKAKGRRGKDMRTRIECFSRLVLRLGQEKRELERRLDREKSRADGAERDAARARQRVVMECGVEERSNYAGPYYQVCLNYDAMHLIKTRGVDIERFNRVISFHMMRAAEAAIEEAGMPNLVRRSS